jgi:hypothetical protein
MAERRSAASRRTTPSSGRTTPKGGGRGPTPAGGSRARTANATTGRYTPPVPQAQKVSPLWVPILMFTLLGLGVAVIILNYLNLLPGDADNRYLVLGMAFITGGFVTATNYR